MTERETAAGQELPMPPAERQECFDLRCAAKRWLPLPDGAMRRFKRWAKLYPAQYREIGAEVFEATKPFGSRSPV